MSKLSPFWLFTIVIGAASFAACDVDEDARFDDFENRELSCPADKTLVTENYEPEDVMVLHGVDATHARWDEIAGKCDLGCDCDVTFQPKCSDGSDPISAPYMGGWVTSISDFASIPEHRCEGSEDVDGSTADFECVFICLNDDYETATMGCCLDAPSADDGGTDGGTDGGATSSSSSTGSSSSSTGSSSSSTGSSSSGTGSSSSSTGSSSSSTTG